MQAVAAWARRQLLQVYPDDRGLPLRRLAARRAGTGHPRSILFTFFGRIAGAEGVVEERVVPVRIALDGRPLGDADSDLAALVGAADAPGEVSLETLSPFRERFDDLAAAARQEALRRLSVAAASIRRRRQDLAGVLRADAEAYRADRLSELADEEARGRGLVEATGQVLLWAAEERARYSVDARRAAVDTYVRARLQEIAAFERVDEPAEPAPLGALFLVPEVL